MSDQPGAQELDALRARLDALDGELLGLVAERMALVRQIGEVKAREGLALFDRRRERDVLARAASRASGLGMPGWVGESVMQSVIEASHRLQEGVLQAALPADPAEPRRVLILGGAGQMGRLLGGALAGRGHRVERLDRDDPWDEARLRDADVVMVAVPMSLAAELTRRAAGCMREDALLCDINSLKAEICEIYEGMSAGEAVGLHPMFGPTVQTLRRQKVVVCPVRRGPLAAWLEAELRALGLELIESTPREHDRMMAVVQVLVHFRTLVMGEALRRTGVGVAESLDYTSPIYRLELAVVGRLFDQDPLLYAEIEMENPYGDEVRRHFAEATAAVAAVIEGGDREGFCAMFNEIRGYFDGFTAEAMALSDFVIEALVSRA